jgi:hypothetical protein
VSLRKESNKKADVFTSAFLTVLEAGIEPALPKEQDFESSASTSSATRAFPIFGLFVFSLERVQK